MNVNILFLVLALVAEILGTIGGFGSSVFFVPLGSFFLDFHSVLGLTAVLHLASNVSKLALFKNGLNTRLIIYIGIPSVVFVIVGSYLTKYLYTDVLSIALAIFLIGFSALFLIRKKLVVPPTKRNSWLGGTISGFSAGLLGTGGAIRGLVMAAFNLEKTVFIATSAFIDLFIDFSRAVVYYRNGYIHRHDFVYIPFLFAVALLGSFIGKKILNRIPQKNFIRFSLFMILTIGLFTLLENFTTYVQVVGGKN
jgi:uncharacterized membrane protein YfcA